MALESFAASSESLLGQSSIDVSDKQSRMADVETVELVNGGSGGTSVKESRNEMLRNRSACTRRC